MSHSSQSFSRYRSRCHLIAAFVCSLVAGIQYFALMAKSTAVRAELDTTLNQRQSLVEQSEALNQRLQVLLAEEAVLKEDLQLLHKRVPYKADEHDFLESLAHQVEQSGMEILEFQPGRAESEQQFEKLPVRISAVCSWSELCQFLFSMNELPRLCSVDEVRISVPELGKEQLQINLSIGIFSAFPTMMAQSVEGGLR